MENDYLQALAQVVLPTEILDYFSITGIAQTATEIHISLDERMNNALSNDAHFESKGFMEVANVTDFPIRDHKVILKIRRRRWKDLRTGKFQHSDRHRHCSQRHALLQRIWSFFKRDVWRRPQ